MPWKETAKRRARGRARIADCKAKGWTAVLFPVEVRYWGFPAQSMWKLFQTLVIMSTVRGAAVRQLAPAAEKRPAGYDTDEKSSWNQRGYCHIINFEFTLAQ